MTLHAEYITAIEQRLAWLKWVQSGRGEHVWRQLGFEDAIPAYRAVVEGAQALLGQKTTVLL